MNTRRREFLIASAAAAAPLVLAQNPAPPLTAGQVIERIKARVGVPWRPQTVDNIICGSADTPVKGIATTMMATLDVMQRAAAAGLNMVITHEPTFYSHQDTTDQLKNDPTYGFKLDFAKTNGLLTFHFHDHWHAHQPDGIAVGMARELGWAKNADPQNPRLFTFEPTPLSRLAKEIQVKLKARTMRVVGDPALTVKRVIASWGYCSQFPGIPLLARGDVDALIVGETREWELVEYAQDAISSGQQKALIIIGHVLSEQAGMKYCAEWLRSFIPEVPIQFVPAPEPFWAPDHPVGPSARA